MTQDDGCFVTYDHIPARSTVDSTFERDTKQLEEAGRHAIQRDRHAYTFGRPAHALDELNRYCWKDAPELVELPYAYRRENHYGFGRAYMSRLGVNKIVDDYGQ